MKNNETNNKIQIVKPSILPGFMELTPNDQIKFNQMKDTIRKNYENAGFLPIDTPIIEKSEVLLAKGGGETEQQIYKVVKGSTDMSLRFDLTVPLARYVSMNYANLSFPFKRYQIGKVYRGERNQRGRFREFYQADIDIIGNNTLDIINDAEIPSIIYSTFKDLGFEFFTIKINNRKILNGLFNSLNIADSKYVLRAIDKLEKIGVDNVIKELEELEIDKNSINQIISFTNIKGSNEEIINKLKTLNITNELFNLGIEELENTVKYIKQFGVPEENLEIDLTIARGLDYYTGTVYETFLNEYPEIGSVCSGGRYDDLATYYTSQKLPGVGISIGLTRLFFVLNDMNLIKDTKPLIKIIVIPMENCEEEAINIVSKLRNENINTQIFFENIKIGRKFNYADKLNIPYAIVVGEEEIKSKKYALKNMLTGDQESYLLEDIIEILKK